MPLPNEILNGRYNRFLARLFGIQGDTPSPQLSPEIQPGFDYPFQPEHYWLMSERLCTGALLISAVAAKRPVVQLRNPPGSGFLVVVEQIRTVVASADPHCIGIGASATTLPILPAAGQLLVRDTRSGPAIQVPAAQFAGDNEPPTMFPPNITFTTSTANTSLVTNVAAVLTPGFAVQAWIDALNTAMRCTMAWREVAVTPMELAQ